MRLVLVGAAILTLVTALVVFSPTTGTAGDEETNKGQGVEAQPVAKKSETRTAEAKAEPKDLPAGAMGISAMLPPNAKAFVNRKQQRVRKHLRPVPIGPRPAGAAPMAKPAADTAASVETAFAPMAASNVKLVVNRGLKDSETNNQTGTVCEPSLAVRDKEILLTGNWFAAFSKDSGATFQYRNPTTTFPRSPHGEFCCDQVALYDKKHDLMIWLLQYISNETGNILRVAVAKGNDIRNEQWRYYDFSPAAVGGWKKEWFDYPDLVAGDKYLYVSSNVFGTGDDQFTRSVMLRLPLAELSAYKPFNYQFFQSEEVGSLRATPGVTEAEPKTKAQSTMYFGAHLNQGTVRLFSWPENAAAVDKPTDIRVNAWSDDRRFAEGPDGFDWLGRADGRITGAWQNKDTIGFAWTAAQDDQFRYPHVRVVLIAKKDKKVVRQPHLWSNDFAFAYPAVAPNEDGEAGISVHFGGGTTRPSHAVGFLSGGKKWDLVLTAAGTSGPYDGTWGDYLAVRRHGAQPKTWVATGFTLQGGPLNKDVEIRYVHFKKN